MGYIKNRGGAQAYPPGWAGGPAVAAGRAGGPAGPRPAVAAGGGAGGKNRSAMRRPAARARGGPLSPGVARLPRLPAPTSDNVYYVNGADPRCPWAARLSGFAGCSVLRYVNPNAKHIYKVAFGVARFCAAAAAAGHNIAFGRGHASRRCRPAGHLFMAVRRVNDPAARTHLAAKNCEITSYSELSAVISL